MTLQGRFVPGKILISIAVLAVGGGLLAQTLRRSPRIPFYGYQVVHAYPHDREAFTEGLEFHDGFLYESTGLNGKSSLRKVKLETGEVLQSVPLEREYFGEGITIVNDRVIQLTYTTGLGFVFGLKDFREQKRFRYAGEGWALTHNSANIFMDDGTDEIRVWDRETLAEKRRIPVRDGGTPVDNLNELEWVEGELFANIWQTDRIARISPTTGQVTGWIDLTGLLREDDRDGTEDLLNGIAYDAVRKRLFVTGKLWPKVFEIRLVPRR